MNSYYEKFLASGEVKCIDDEIPFEIPQGWEWCRISDVCMMQAGKNITADKIFSEQSEVYPYRCVGGNGLRGYVAEFNTEGNHAIVGRQGALCGCLNIETGNFYATEHAVVVSSFGNIHYKFMYWFLMALNLNQLATATAQPGLSVAKVMDSYFPLPPLSEQQRITAKIEELIPIVEKFDKVQTSLDAINNSINDLLKKSILQEAIQGKLVPQITREGTAQELLEQIKQEKYRLVKEGKLKRSALTDSVIYKGDDNKYFEKIGEIEKDITDEIPFEIPDSWAWVRHNDLFDISGGSQPPKSIFQTQEKEGYIRLFQIRDYGPNPQPVHIPLSTASKISQKGDILLARYGASLGKVFYAEYGAYNVALAKVIPLYESPLIFQKYIFLYYCSSIYQNEIVNRSRCAQAGFNKEDLNSLLFPLPPLAEQYRIVEKYEKAIASIMSR
ncbi:restriction endonuclease subunit S [Bacteroides fragilis]|uniref:restriction endonuclease subunit S n=1 Tax=Bacteroides fragilis TaxID=817 RepID=UPI00245784FF|nr:restriction endonuclease subunit S [Bacteroides fragilis]